MNVAPMSGVSGLADVLLMDVAERVQLAPSAYRLGVERYETMGRHLERAESPLRGLVTRLYAQGSMAIGAVVSSKFDNDEFDVDVIVELAIRSNEAPGAVLDTLYRAIRGDSDSRYFKATKRRTRCVTVEYDEMHIDFTPAVRLADPRERVSNIFHAHEDESADKHRHVIANPWGFADWFESQMPAAREFADAVLRKAAEPLPSQEDLNEKALPLIALQLIKRWRNKCYDKRLDVRSPPSVVLATMVAGNLGPRRGLLEELRGQVANLCYQIDQATAAGRMLHVMNPACGEADCFTDRWPESLDHQRLFLGDLRKFVVALAELAQTQTIEGCQRILGQLFGERATTAALDQFKKRYEASAAAKRLYHQPGTAAVALRESGIGKTAPAVAAIATPGHTFFGSEEEM